MSIVGTKIETFLTVVRTYPLRTFRVTKHTIVQDLHATKGWRVARKRQEITTWPYWTQARRYCEKHTSCVFKSSNAPRTGLARLQVRP